jgi:ribosome maturation factor RimP
VDPPFVSMGIGLKEWQERLRPVLEEQGAELLEVHLSRGRKSVQLRFFVDREEGVGVDDLAVLSRKIARLLDADPLLEGAYSLEVSSPGMNRVVRTEAHFRRFLGERVHVWTYSAHHDRTHFEGTIGRCGEGVVSVEVDQLGTVEFRLDEIRRAELRLDPRRPPADAKRRIEARRQEVAGHDE